MFFEFFDLCDISPIFGRFKKHIQQIRIMPLRITIFVTLLLDMLETFWCLTTCFWGMGNHLGPLSEALEWAEGAVGGQGPHQGVNF